MAEDDKDTDDKGESTIKEKLTLSGLIVCALVVYGAVDDASKFWLRVIWWGFVMVMMGAVGVAGGYYVYRSIKWRVNKKAWAEDTDDKDTDDKDTDDKDTDDKDTDDKDTDDKDTDDKDTDDKDTDDKDTDDKDTDDKDTDDKDTDDKDTDDKGAVLQGFVMVMLAGIFFYNFMETYRSSKWRVEAPVKDLVRDLDRYPEYSLIVDDTRVEERFLRVYDDYALCFQVLTASGQRVAGRDTIVYQERRTNWLEVSEETFYRYDNYVGMVVASKSLDGRRTGVNQAHPPGYQYVGNPQYGYWGNGGFWQFYGRYALMRDLMGGWGVGRGDWEDYRRHRERGRPYYGPEKGGRPTFGSLGSQTQKTRPQFYQRQQSRHQAFKGQVKNRMGRGTSRFGK